MQSNVEYFNFFLLDILHTLYFNFPVAEPLDLEKFLSRIEELEKPELDLDRYPYIGPDFLKVERSSLFFEYWFQTNDGKGYQRLPYPEQLDWPDFVENSETLSMQMSNFLNKFDLEEALEKRAAKSEFWGFGGSEKADWEVAIEQYQSLCHQIGIEVLSQYDWSNKISELQDMLGRALTEEELKVLKTKGIRPLTSREISLHEAYQEDVENYHSLKEALQIDNDKKKKILKATIKFLVSEGYIRIHHIKKVDSGELQPPDILIEHAFPKLKFVLTSKGINILNVHLTHQGLETRRLKDKLFEWVNGGRTATTLSIVESILSVGSQI